MGSSRKVQKSEGQVQERLLSRVSDFIFLRGREKVPSPRSIQDITIKEAKGGQDYPSIKRETNLKSSIDNFRLYYNLEKIWINSVISEHYQISGASEDRFAVINIFEKAFGAIHSIYKIKNNKNLDYIPEKDLKREYFIQRVSEDIREGFQSVCKTDADRVALVGEILKELNFGKEQLKLLASSVEQIRPWRLDDATPPSGETYAQRRDRKESAPAFIERVYGGAGWLTGNFTRADLRKIDPDAAMGLANWEKNHQKRAPLNLPTKQEANDRLLASGAPIETDDPRETARRRSAAWRRQQPRR